MHVLQDVLAAPLLLCDTVVRKLEGNRLEYGRTACRALPLCLFSISHCTDMPHRPQADGGHFHAVKFYENPESLCRIVAEFLSEGLAQQQPALVIATLEHRGGIVQELSARHFDVPKLQRTGDLLMLDATV